MSYIYYLPAIYYVSGDKIHQYINYQQAHKVIRMNPEPNVLIRLSNFFTEPTKITDEIYLGSAFNACNSSQLSTRNIKTIANISTELTNYYEGYKDFEYFNIKVNDINEDSIKDYLESFLDFMDNHKGKPILVHCFAGSSRSATCMLYYLIKRKDYLYDEALKLLTNLRPCVNINITFLNEIMSLL